MKNQKTQDPSEATRNALILALKEEICLAEDILEIDLRRHEPDDVRLDRQAIQRMRRQLIALKKGVMADEHPRDKFYREFFKESCYSA